MDYPREQFSNPERRLLEAHFTNLDRPVFCVVNLPEVVKGALFARYSRYPGTLRRLFLDEFATETEAEQRSARPAADPSAGSPAEGSSNRGAERAERLYERVFIEY